MLLFNALGQIGQIFHSALDPALGAGELDAAHQRSGAHPAAAGTIDDRHDHRQITQQFLGRGRRRGFDLFLGFQEQLGRVENPLADAGRGLAPSGVDLPGLAAAEAIFGKRFGHPFTVGRVGARHRNQILHGGMRRDPPVADALLHAFGNLLDQRKPARHPTETAIETLRQILQAVAEALFEFFKQPALLQRRLALG